MHIAASLSSHQLGSGPIRKDAFWELVNVFPRVVVSEASAFPSGDVLEISRAKSMPPCECRKGIAFLQLSTEDSPVETRDLHDDLNRNHPLFLLSRS